MLVLVRLFYFTPTSIILLRLKNPLLKARCVLQVTMDSTRARTMPTRHISLTEFTSASCCSASLSLVGEWFSIATEYVTTQPHTGVPFDIPR
jgi:hypothetical protein